ncbi:DUF2892 domain-containing protein [Candidatus Ornithobacterium hominis]|uniref:DUF2892 domain-containing protein n=1 Tax=Candidatus Ornithobacterium hominis TaxID=2497989 RepID=UPI0024BD1C7D|nr:DUF2892 domain-containing protein [Candidatus Ornithobacterium hominis]CAI9429033.1 DUF2892 domain-containing protein [Candidatus Ornithobacterium hominis]
MHKNIKITLATLLVVGAGYLFSEREYGWGVLVSLLAVFPVIFYFRNEYILLAFWQMRKQNLPAAREWLSKITNPDKQLVKKQMGYYHFMNGITLGQDHLRESVNHMKKALDYGLSFAHDRAMAKLNLAAGAMSGGRKNEAKKWLAEAKSEDKQNMLTEHINMMEEQLKRMNVGRNMHNPNMRRKGKFF